MLNKLWIQFSPYVRRYVFNFKWSAQFTNINAIAFAAWNSTYNTVHLNLSYSNLWLVKNAAQLFWDLNEVTIPNDSKNPWKNFRQIIIKRHINKYCRFNALKRERGWKYLIPEYSLNPSNGVVHLDHLDHLVLNPYKFSFSPHWNQLHYHNIAKLMSLYKTLYIQEGHLTKKWFIGLRMFSSYKWKCELFEKMNQTSLWTRISKYGN